MPCPVCKTTIESGVDHRMCVFQLFESNTIQSVEEWTAMATKPVTIVKGRIRARIYADPKTNPQCSPSSSTS